MKNSPGLLSSILALSSAAVAFGASSSPSVHIDLSKRGADIPASLYGIFFEEITGSGDGGLYGELIRNRGFEEGVLPAGTSLDADGFAAAKHARCYSNDSINRFRVHWNPDKGMTAWRVVLADGAKAETSLVTDNPLNSATPHSLAIDLGAARQSVSVINEGYWGIGMKKGEKYDLEFYARSASVKDCVVEVIDKNGTPVATAKVKLKSDGKWNRYTATLSSEASASGCSMKLTFPPKGKIWLDYVSLFPENTFKGRPGGLRKDIATAIADLKPAFMRWPGGCIVEGLTLDNRVKWKETIGNPVERPGEYDLWGYRSTYGLGYHEFLQFCEDIGADGMFVCNAGMSCLFRNGDYVQGDDLQPLIDEVLDAIEYAVGDAETTRWGAERARNGHPAPFPLKYVEIGNENVFYRYAENYNRFHKAIKERYPDITLITALMFSDDIKHLDEVEIIDPHYYETADWFYNNADVFDKLSRDTPYKVYIGEYAAGPSNLYSSLAEAAFMTGVERNGDKVQLMSYAPLLQNAHYGCNHMIVFDDTETFGRSNYHIMKLFSENRPDFNVATEILGEQTALPVIPNGAIGVGTAGSTAEFRDIVVESDGKVVYSSDFSDLDSRWTPFGGNWDVKDGVLAQTSRDGENFLRLDSLDLSDCSISLKARKTGGGQGFRVIFGMQSPSECYMADMGSHSNESVLFRENNPQKGSVSLFDYRNQMPILRDKWYDVRIDIKGSVWECWLDGELAYSYDYQAPSKHYAVAGVDEQAGELVVKLVNARTEPWITSLDITAGDMSIAGDARRFDLAAPSIYDENSFEQPELVSARESLFSIPALNAAPLPIECKPNSVTLLRIPLKK